MMGEDSLYLRWNGGGGYGDPLEREPEALLTDCRERIVSVEVARDVYGAVFAGDLDSVDEAATNARRAELRGQRTAGTAQ
jgi:N-methylhydantoinase B